MDSTSFTALILLTSSFGKVVTCYVFNYISLTIARSALIKYAHGRPWKHVNAYLHVQVVCCQVPTPHPVLIGKTYNYTCPSNNETTSLIQMIVTVPGNAPIAPPDALGTLASRGVVVIGLDTVSFRANTSNNNTIVSCTYKKTAVIYHIGIIFTVYGTSAITRIASSFTCKIYMADALQPPQLLQVHVQGSSASHLFFNVTWTPPPYKSVLNYVVSVLNQSGPSNNFTPVELIKTENCSYTFPHPSSPTSCYRYQFAVAAEYAAGISQYSNPVWANVVTG